MLGKSLNYTFALLAATGAFVSTGYAQTPSTTPSLVAFVHASVIPMDKERVLHDQTVVVANGKIVDIGPGSAVKVPDGGLRIDAGGQYLLPALCDMHVHLLGAYKAPAPGPVGPLGETALGANIALAW